MQKLKNLAVDLSDPKNFNKLPTFKFLTFEEGILLSYLLFLGKVHMSCEELFKKLPMLESTDKINQLRKQLNRKQLLFIGTKSGILSWGIRKDKLQELLLLEDTQPTRG